jgi:hypothetical protein
VHFITLGRSLQGKDNLVSYTILNLLGFFLLKQSLMGTMLCAKANVCVVMLINPYDEWFKIKCLFYNLLVNHTCLPWQINLTDA